MRPLRAKVLRYDVYWNEIAPKRPAKPRDPASPEYDWENLDRLWRTRPPTGGHRADVVADAALGAGRQRPGRQAQPLLLGPAAVADWRNFVYAAATRYSGTFDPDGEGYGGPLPLVRFWEMWNEPNYIGALRPQRKAGKPTSPALYSGILNAGYAEISRVERERKLKLTCWAAP